MSHLAGLNTYWVDEGPLPDNRPYPTETDPVRRAQLDVLTPADLDWLKYVGGRP